MKTKATKIKTIILYVFYSLIFLTSCTKRQNIQDNQKYSLTKITSNYFGVFADTSDYYNVTYNNKQVSTLTGKSNTVFNVTYPSQTGFNRNTTALLDSCIYDVVGNNLLWAVRYYNSIYYKQAQLQYPTSNTAVVTYKDQNTVTNRARITYNNDGDILSIGYYNGTPDTGDS